MAHELIFNSPTCAFCGHEPGECTCKPTANNNPRGWGIRPDDEFLDAWDDSDSDAEPDDGPLTDVLAQPTMLDFIDQSPEPSDRGETLSPFYGGD